MKRTLKHITGLILFVVPLLVQAADVPLQHIPLTDIQTISMPIEADISKMKVSPNLKPTATILTRDMAKSVPTNQQVVNTQSVVKANTPKTIGNKSKKNPGEGVSIKLQPLDVGKVKR